MNIYKDLAILFLNLGMTAFGGPMAHIAMLEKEVVEKRKWFDADEFLEMVGFTNLIPGPNSTEVALLVGYRKAGILGLLVSGVCFIIPAVIIVMALTFMYLKTQSIPNVQEIMNGVKPVIAAIVSMATYKLFIKSSKSWLNILVVVILSLLLLTGVLSEISTLLLCAGGYLFLNLSKYKSRYNSIEPYSLSLLFWSVAKIGSLLYGSGYVLISFLEATFVERLQWIDFNTLTNLVTLGEISPGPVFTTATALGTYLGGILGGVVATIGIFLPSFLLVSILFPLYDKLKTLSWFNVALEGVALGSLALLLKTSILLTGQLFFSPVSVFLYLCALYLIYKNKIKPVYLIIIFGLLGMIFL